MIRRDAGLGGGAREAGGRGALDRRVVVAVADHVDEEVGDVDVAQRVGEAVGAGQVAAGELGPGLGELAGALGVRVADEDPGLDPVVEQALGRAGCR